jgi:predicted DCC family thiol-disulfide oxidoreductase YuxK
LTAAPETDRSLVLYDGDCRLCRGAVSFIARHDPRGRFRCETLQSRAVELAPLAAGPGGDVLRGLAAADGRPGTLVLIEGGRAFVRSTAALRIARRLRFPWNLLTIGLLVPRPVRDAVYDMVARRRRREVGG